MTLTLRKKTWMLYHQITSEEIESVFVGTNYKDEPTLNAETKKPNQNNLNKLRIKKVTQITNGSN
jgi:hypothetical protein